MNDGVAMEMAASLRVWLRLGAGEDEAVLADLCAAALAACAAYVGAPLPEPLPPPLAQGMVRYAAFLYAARDDARDAVPPAAVLALWQPYRRVRL